LTGFAWPREAIPAPALVAGQIFPADFAIQGIVRIDQLGASLSEVAGDWRGLWYLVIVYLVLAVVFAHLAGRRRANG
jgi:ABC-2 type transport system permease protein